MSDRNVAINTIPLLLHRQFTILKLLLRSEEGFSVTRDVGIHRLQLSQNLRDSPGFLAVVVGTERHYYKRIVVPG